MNIIEYNLGLGAAVNKGDRSAAARVLPEAIIRGRKGDALLAWIAAHGPFKMTVQAPAAGASTPGVILAASAAGPSEWELALSSFVDSSSVFSTVAEAEIVANTLREQTDVMQWNGRIDVMSRAPLHLRRSLETPQAVLPEDSFTTFIRENGEKPLLPEKPKKKKSLAGPALAAGAILAGVIYWRKTRR